MGTFLCVSFETFCFKNTLANYQGIMVGNYQANNKGISSGKVLYGIVTTKIMYFCNISGIMWCTAMYDLSF